MLSIQRHWKPRKWGFVMEMKKYETIFNSTLMTMHLQSEIIDSFKSHSDLGKPLIHYCCPLEHLPLSLYNPFITFLRQMMDVLEEYSKIMIKVIHTITLSTLVTNLKSNLILELPDLSNGVSFTAMWLIH